MNLQKLSQKNIHIKNNFLTYLEKEKVPNQLAFFLFLSHLGEIEGTNQFF